MTINILYRLIQKNYDVVCFMADVGQNEDFAKATEKAKRIGAKDVSTYSKTYILLVKLFHI